MNNFIKVNHYITNTPIYININHIGHIYNSNDGYTVIGTIIHKHGGFRAKETVEEILKLIKDKSK